MPRHVALGFLCETRSYRGMPKPCLGMRGHAAACKTVPRHAHQHFSFSALLVLFRLLFGPFCSSITYKIKITCKNSQNCDKQDKNTKYKRVKYTHNSPLSRIIHYPQLYVLSFLTLQLLQHLHPHIANLQ